MSQRWVVRRVLALLVLGVVAIWAPRGEARLGDHVGGGFEARLVRCADVTVPAALSGCGSDPLAVGLLQIEFGTLRIIINSAARDASYTVVLQSPGGGPDAALGIVTTNHGGHGQLQARVFEQGDVASGFIVLRRAGSDQFVSGIRLVGGGSAKVVPGSGSGTGGDNEMEAEDESEDEEFDARLVRCGDVNVPGALSNCGSDPLQEGEAEVEKHGGLEIKVRHAAANATYDIVLRPLRGADFPLGTLTTDAEGDAHLERAGVFAPPGKVAGLIVLRRNGADQFVQGFRVLALAAVLPASRSVRVGVAATAFASIINMGPSTATDCRIVLVSDVPATLTFQTTDPATNGVTGTSNAPVNIPSGGFQSFVISITPSAPFPPTDVAFNFSCANTAPATVLSGLNTLLLSASTTPTSDIVALGATIGNTGIVNIPGPSGTGFFGVATVNVGASGQITVSADTGSASLAVDLLVCETNPATGVCLGAPTNAVTTQINSGQTPTFAIVVQGKGTPISSDLANNRVIVRFKDAGGATRGATSVAVTTQ